MKEKYHCCICGRENSRKRISKEYYCEKHYEQMRTYGFCIDNDPRDAEDPNEIIPHENHAEIVLYDEFQEDTGKRALIDLEDIDKVKNIHWDKKQKCIVGRIKDKEILLQNHILNTNDKINFVSEDAFDCRKFNLYIKEKKERKPKKSKDNKIIIESLSGSTIDVTGSSWSVSYPKKDGTMGLFLIESGMIQGGTVLEDYKNNRRAVDYTPYEDAEFILIGHPHVDHIGNIPASISRGFIGNIYGTKECLSICEKLMLDTSFIHERNIKDINKGGKKYEQLFTESDVYLSINKFKEVPMHEMIKINEYITVKFIDNSHCYGASQIEIYIRKPSNHIIKLLYTSDLGSKHNINFQPFVKENDLCNKADIMIMESTYGDRVPFTKEECIKERKDLINNIKNIINNNHRCLVPCFSFQRSQMMLCFLYDNFKNIDIGNTMIICDSRLTNDINNVFLNTLKSEDREYFKNVLSWDRIKYINSFKETEKFMVKKDQPMIIISSSGMLENGHSKSWCKSILPKKDDAIFFIGFCGKNTLGNRIQNENTKSVTIDGVSYTKKCNINIYKSFSSHAQQSDLLEYIKHINIGKSIILHHGSETAKNTLKELGTKELHNIGKTSKIIVTDKNCNTFKF